MLGNFRMATMAAFTALRDPKRAGRENGADRSLDMVAALGEVTGEMALERLRDTMLMDVGGRKILRTRPIIHSSIVDLDKLAALPSNTFGFGYHSFLSSHGFSPDKRDQVR
jgi:ubiquinone biosynthesis protein COQ4